MIRIQANKQAHGFTIVELLVVIIVIAILVTITTVSYIVVSDNANEQAAKTDAQTIATHLNKYKAKHGSYPATLSDLVDVPGTQAEFQYTRNLSTDTYCVTAFVVSATAYVQSGSLDAIPGKCAGHSFEGE